MCYAIYMQYEEDFEVEEAIETEVERDNNSETRIEVLKRKAAAHDRVKEGQARRNRRRNARGTFGLLKNFFAGSKYAESVPADYWAWIEKGPSISLSKYARAGFSEESDLVSKNMERIEDYLQASRFYSRDVVADEFPVSESYTCEACGFNSSYRDLFRLVDTTPLEEYEYEYRLSQESEHTILCCLNCQAKHVLRLEVDTTTTECEEEEGGFIDD